MMKKVDLRSGTIAEPEYLYTLENRNFIGFAISDTKAHIGEYKRAAEQIQKLLLLLEQV